MTCAGRALEGDVDAVVRAPQDVVHVGFQRQVGARPEHHAQRERVGQRDGRRPRLIGQRGREVGVGRIEVRLSVELQANAAAIGQRHVHLVGQRPIEQGGVAAEPPGAAAQAHVAAGQRRKAVREVDRPADRVEADRQRQPVLEPHGHRRVDCHRLQRGGHGRLAPEPVVGPAHADAEGRVDAQADRHAVADRRVREHRRQEEVAALAVRRAAAGGGRKARLDRHVDAARRRARPHERQRRRVEPDRRRLVRRGRDRRGAPDGFAGQVVDQEAAGPAEARAAQRRRGRQRARQPKPLHGVPPKLKAKQ